MTCRKCWAPGAAAIEVVKDGETVAFGELCDACFDKALDGAAKLRSEFEGLLAAGVSREDANEHLCRKIRGEVAS